MNLSIIEIHWSSPPPSLDPLNSTYPSHTNDVFLSHQKLFNRIIMHSESPVPLVAPLFLSSVTNKCHRNEKKRKTRPTKEVGRGMLEPKDMLQYWEYTKRLKKDNELKKVIKKLQHKNSHIDVGLCVCVLVGGICVCVCLRLSVCMCTFITI